MFYGVAHECTVIIADNNSMTQEQNTATSADKVLTDLFPYDRDNFSRLMATQAIEHYHASKLKELSEKGEPSESDRDLCAQHYVEHNRFAHIGAAYCSGWIDLHDRLSPVIAALRAENKKKDEEIAFLRALETELAEFAEWASDKGWFHTKNSIWYHSVSPEKKTTVQLLTQFRALKGGKAHEYEKQLTYADFPNSMYHDLPFYTMVELWMSQEGMVRGMKVRNCGEDKILLESTVDYKDAYPISWFSGWRQCLSATARVAELETGLREIRYEIEEASKELTGEPDEENATRAKIATDTSIVLINRLLSPPQNTKGDDKN